MPEPNETPETEASETGDQSSSATPPATPQQTQPQSSTQAPLPTATPQPTQQSQGYVPVGEVAKERGKVKDLTGKLTEAEQKVRNYEQRDAKRGFFKEALKGIGENFTVPGDLDEVIDALSYDFANPEATKTVIAKLVEQAKKPVRTGPNTPMFGNVPRDQNQSQGGPAKSEKVTLGERMQAAIGVKA